MTEHLVWDSSSCCFQNLLMLQGILVGAIGLNQRPLRPRKTNYRYVIGPFRSALRLLLWFSTVFGCYWTQIGPKFQSLVLRLEPWLRARGVVAVTVSRSHLAATDCHSAALTAAQFVTVAFPHIS